MYMTRSVILEGCRSVKRVCYRKRQPLRVVRVHRLFAQRVRGVQQVPIGIIAIDGGVPQSISGAQHLMPAVIGVCRNAPQRISFSQPVWHFVNDLPAGHLHANCSVGDHRFANERLWADKANNEILPL
jgi:hypothetical protein